MTSSHCYPNFNTIIHGILGFYLHEACGRTIEALNFGPITNNLKNINIYQIIFISKNDK